MTQSVRHYVQIYQARLAMQEQGLIQPNPEVKAWTQARRAVDRLSVLP